MDIKLNAKTHRGQTFGWQLTVVLYLGGKGKKRSFYGGNISCCPAIEINT